MVEDKTVDIVYIATPHSFYLEHTTLCLNHKKSQHYNHLLSHRRHHLLRTPFNKKSRLSRRALNNNNNNSNNKRREHQIRFPHRATLLQEECCHLSIDSHSSHLLLWLSTVRIWMTYLTFPWTDRPRRRHHPRYWTIDDRIVW